MKKTISRFLILLVLILPAYLTLVTRQNQVRAVPVTNLKDTLSSAQLSYFARLINANGTLLKIDPANNPSRITGNLGSGDTVAIANSATTSLFYTIKDVPDASSLEISPSIGTTIVNSFVIATRSAIHTVTFTPAAAISGEKWQFLIKATNRSGEVANDGIPDQMGFDLGSTTPGGPSTGLGTRLQAADVTCPGGSTASVGTTVNITSGINVGSTGIYHVIECDYAVGSSNPGTATTITVGRPLTTGSQLINPSPALNHTPGQANSVADTYAFAIRQLDNSGNILDTTFGKIAATESVRVTAIVDPTITLTISNSGATTIGTTRCASALGNGAPNTTATSVSFGPLVLGGYNNLAQMLSCTTNSTNGYVVQAFENRPMTMTNAATTLPDTTCESTGCNPTTQKTWTGFTQSGFGYSLENAAGSPTIAVTSGQYKSFGLNGNAQTLFSRATTPPTTDSVYICYRATASTAQPAGTYENTVSFIATATF